jgi:hypothetical protein
VGLFVEREANSESIEAALARAYEGLRSQPRRRGKRLPLKHGRWRRVLPRRSSTASLGGSCSLWPSSCSSWPWRSPPRLLTGSTIPGRSTTSLALCWRWSSDTPEASLLHRTLAGCGGRSGALPERTLRPAPRSGRQRHPALAADGPRIGTSRPRRAALVRAAKRGGLHDPSSCLRSGNRTCTTGVSRSDRSAVKRRAP